jgi:NAD(P)-dependent dehydrogenase (short-subunit alcohol dehydrogenase family)
MANSIVIGGTRGMGSVIADHLSDRGDMVYTVSRSSSKRENHIKCDISFDCASIIDNIDSIDYLVFSHRYRGSDWNEMFDVNVKSVRNLIELTVSKFKNGGSVVVISSNASHFVLDEQSAEYHSSKAALESMVRYYAVKYGKKNIRFNSILPSTLLKPENLDFFTKNNKVRKMIENITPLGRMGEADDIANMVEFLCSPKSTFITGNSFFVDGGLSLVGQETIARNLLGCTHEK